MLFLESENPDKDISIYINSPGGDINALLAIYDTMQYIRPADHARSASARRRRPPRCCWPRARPASVWRCPTPRILIHQPYAQSGYAQVSDLEIAANEIIRLKETLEEVLARPHRPGHGANRQGHRP